MDRRTLFQGATAAALTALAGTVQAADDEHAHHHMHGGGSKNANLIATASDCLTKGEACLAHCLVLLGDGQKEMAGCARSVNQMLAICTALHKVAVQDGNMLPAMAKVAAQTCEACEKECRKHADKHAECKACADSCAACLKECKALAA